MAPRKAMTKARISRMENLQIKVADGIGAFPAKDAKTSSPYRLQWLSIVDKEDTGKMFRINHQNACKKNTDLFLLVLVKSGAGNFKRRQTWRENWGAIKSVNGREIRVFFVTAMTDDVTSQYKMEIENVRFGDILQGVFKDNYANNTFKLLSSFEWANSYCSNAEYVLSVDDDVMVVPARLVTFLTKNNDVNLIGGYIIPAMVRKLDNNSKWFVNFTNYPYLYYPDYVTGFAVVLSGPLIPRLLKASESLQYMFHVDDAYIGLCAFSIDVKPVFISGFELYRLEANLDYSYEKYKSVIAIHGLNETEKVKLWRHLLVDLDLRLEQRWLPYPHFVMNSSDTI
ncbi:lactosylceramide 1,3-N-acetyl-beta-D-glucosaminyltransferase B-like [Lineus longissimus]|uniref:lactosylceramide 1,3-N-acetyl-beta-D-glucosaminyltransferase B-like n=1 Tax=Lineus longissimus TaxID=88925 RepID=UPI00315D023C